MIDTISVDELIQLRKAVKFWKTGAFTGWTMVAITFVGIIVS